MKNAKNYKNSQTGSLIHELRKSAGLSQEELAEEIDCSSQTISNIENDRYLSKDIALKLSNFFKVPLDYILGNIEKPDEYKKAFIEDVSIMSQAAKARETIVDYLIISEGNRKIKLSESEKELLMNEIIWYGRVRLQKIIRERER